MTKAKNKKKSEFVNKLGKQMLGAGLIVTAVFVWTSYAGYNPNDPSFNMASSAPVQNYLGLLGATVANITLGAFGFSFPIFLIAFLMWGYSFIRYQNVPEFKCRILSFILGVIFFSTMLGLKSIYVFTNVSTSGYLGKYAADKLMTFISKFADFSHTSEVTMGVLGLFSFFFFNFACGITCKKWYSFFRFIALIIVKMCISLKNGVLMIAPSTKKSSMHQAPRTPKIAKETTEKQLEKKKEEVKKELRSRNGEDSYKFPSLDLLSRPKKNKENNEISEKELQETSQKLEEVLNEYGIRGNIIKVRPGPVVTLFELKPAPGTKNTRVIALSDDIARSMSAVSVRIAVVAGSDTIGIEIPNKKRETVWFKDLLESDEFTTSKNSLNVTLGKDIGGKNVYADLAKMPHLLVAGTTGSGKSIGVNTMILSLLYKMTPEECRFIMIDPKMLEFSMYNGIPHLLTPVITDAKKAVVGLKWAVNEMEDRYRLMAQFNVRNIIGYNQKVKEIKESGAPAVRKVHVGFDSENGKPIYEVRDSATDPKSPCRRYPSDYGDAKTFG